MMTFIKKYGIAIIVIVAVIGVGYYFWKKENDKKAAENALAVAAGAAVGSAIGNAAGEMSGLDLIPVGQGTTMNTFN